MGDVTRILNAIEGGDHKATDELLPLVYEELRLLAAQKLSHEKPGQTLQATALVHEAYVRLVESDGSGWGNKMHFFAAAAEAMRRILIDNARRKQTYKSGGDRHRVDLDVQCFSVRLPSEHLLPLDDALSKLEREEPEVARLVKLRYYVGLSMEQVSVALNISIRTAYRLWAFARARLAQELAEDDK
jgi:RNA polymerase sigma factor (TIGR02999 family)